MAYIKRRGDTVDLNSIDFSRHEDVVPLLGDIAYNSNTKSEITDRITELHEIALKKGQNDELDKRLAECNECLGKEADYKFGDFRLRYRYSYSDFAESSKPYEDAFFQPSQFQRQQKLTALQEDAKLCGFTGFKRLYKAFCENMRMKNVTHEGSDILNPTDFPLQPIELEAGEWLCGHDGISKVSGNGCVELACRHPIMPVERLVNIDTGEEKLKVAYYKNGYWRDVIVGKKELFDSSKIIQLAAVGVSVTSKTAKNLAEFMCDIEAMNYQLIPERKSVTRLGWIDGGEQFSPYVEALTFDGDRNYNAIYNAIQPRGDYEKWRETAVKCRRESLTARIMLAASFASALIGKIGALSFFVHLWGIESGTGKTVALMLAASVWGNPEIGQYIQTFNSTEVGHEKTAAFLNSIPMCIDELQLSKDSHGHSKFDVYRLAQGVGRTRGTKTGGLDRTPTWALCVLTTGESPLTSESSGAGAVNRVIDIECRASDAVIRDGLGVSRAVKQNYGWAGGFFVDALTPEVITEAVKIYEGHFAELTKGQTTEKQAMAAAVLLTADELADRFIFQTGEHLTAAQIAEFLKSKTAVSAGERGYGYMCDWVAMNANRFRQASDVGEIYGTIDNDWAYINSSVFRKAAREGGFDDRALLSWLKTKGLILTRGRNMTKGRRIGGVNTECVVMKLHSYEEEVELLD